ncbi:MAG: ABC transporter permease [Desertimonas sp.]
MSGEQRDSRTAATGSAGDDGSSTDPRDPHRRGNAVLNIVAPIIGVALFVVAWWSMHEWGMRGLFDKPPFLLPSPPTVIDQAFLDPTQRSNLLQGLGWTTMVALVGLAVAIVVGMSIAVLMAQASWAERTIWPYLIVAQSIPILAIAPLLGNIFGFGFGTRVLVCVIISIFPIVSNTLFGLLSADAAQHDLFTLRGAGRLTRLLKLQLPAASPAIFTGFRIAAGLSVIGAVVGELFFRQGGKGIGIVMEQYRSRTQFPETYGALILSSLLGIAVFVLFGWLSRLVVGRWHESTRSGG